MARSFASSPLNFIIMAKETLIQHRFVSVPLTSGTSIYKVNFKSDDMYNYLTGIALTFEGARPTADAIEVELRDDFISILSFSPVENWLKNTTSVSWNLADAFRALNVESHGKQFYLNVKVTNSAAFSFTCMFRQSLNAVAVKEYDIQAFTVPAPSLGANFSITLPDDYSKCRGINVVGGDSTNSQYLALDINDARGYILDPVPFNVLIPTVNTQYDNLFFDMDFESKNKEINVRLTALKDIEYTATNYTISFLLLK